MCDIVSTGITSSTKYWDPSQSVAGPRPTVDAIFDPANGYVNEANQLTFKVLFEVSGRDVLLFILFGLEGSSSSFGVFI